jgi:putative endonuclease
MKKYWVYILCSKPKGTLYIGVTNDIERRVYEHKAGLFNGFSKKYLVDKLVYVGEFTDIKEAIIYEKRLKAWKREWKIRLIEEQNPNWDDYMPVDFKCGFLPAQE